MLLKLLVQLVEVSDKVTCACRSKVTFQVNGKVQMVNLVGKEGCNAGSGTRSIVVSELSEWKEFGPIVLLVVAIDSEVLF